MLSKEPLRGTLALVRICSSEHEQETGQETGEELNCVRSHVDVARHR